MYTKINNLTMGFSNKIIPLAYDQSLSYYEQLLNITEKINEVSNTVNNMYDSIIAEVQKDMAKLLAEQKAELEKEIADLEEKLQQEITYNYDKLQVEFTELKDLTEEELQRLQNAVIALNTSISKLYVDWNTYLIACDNKIDKKLENSVKELEKVIEDSLEFASGKYILVNNPIQNKTTDLTTCLEDLYNTFNYSAISAGEYSSLELTAEEYSNLRINALDYGTISRFIFIKELYFKDFVENVKDTLTNVVEYVAEIKESLNMRNPFTGEIVNFKTVIAELVNLHKVNALTAEEYSTKEVTAESYNGYDISAYDYSFSAKQIII